MNEAEVTEGADADTEVNADRAWRRPPRRRGPFIGWTLVGLLLVGWLLAAYFHI